jgi:hypothetical protein
VSDGNRHLTAGLDEVEPRDMVSCVLEKKGLLEGSVGSF